MSTGLRIAPAPTPRRSVSSLLAAVLAVALLAAVLALVPGSRAAEAGGYTWISVDVSSQRVSGDGWTPYVPVTLTLSHPQTPTRTATITIAVGSQMSFSARVTPVFLVRPGDTIVATNGSTTKTLVVGPIALIGSNAAMDSIWGTALPGETIRTRIVGTSKTASGVVPATGRWGVFYSGIYDLVVGTPVDVRELDDDWDATVISVTLPANGDVDYDTIRNTDDNCQWDANVTQYDGDGDGAGAVCDDVDRLSGANRYGTAAAVSAAAFEKADEVFVALGTNFPDALVAAAAGGGCTARCCSPGRIRCRPRRSPNWCVCRLRRCTSWVARMWSAPRLQRRSAGTRRM